MAAGRNQPEGRREARSSLRSKQGTRLVTKAETYRRSHPMKSSIKHSLHAVGAGLLAAAATSFAVSAASAAGEG